MTSARIIEAFAHERSLPIDLDQVVAWLLGNGFQDEIFFIPVELDTGVIRGFLKRFRRPANGLYSEHVNVSHIYYDHRQSLDWQHLVCAKELLHILDAATCATREEFDRLTGSLALPSDMKHLLQDPDFALVDKLGSSVASALLLPVAAREQLMPAYKQGIITDADIAKMAVMPVQHVRSVMSDAWPFIYRVITGGSGPQPSGPDR